MRRFSIALAASLLFNVSARCADTLNIIFTGDILLDRGVRRVINRHGVDHLFSEGIDSVFRSAQIVVGNLECPATKIEAPVFKRYIFRAEPEWLENLQKHGITHLNLANNHSIDQGREGLMDTRSMPIQRMQSVCIVVLFIPNGCLVPCVVLLLVLSIRRAHVC